MSSPGWTRRSRTWMSQAALFVRRSCCHSTHSCHGPTSATLEASSVTKTSLSSGTCLAAPWSHMKLIEDSLNSSDATGTLCAPAIANFSDYNWIPSEGDNIAGEMCCWASKCEVKLGNCKKAMSRKWWWVRVPIAIGSACDRDCIVVPCAGMLSCVLRHYLGKQLDMRDTPSQVSNTW
jgi:hypothetical protein